MKRLFDEDEAEYLFADGPVNARRDLEDEDQRRDNLID